MVLMIPRISITAFSMSPFDSLSPFTASSVVTSVLHISVTRVLNAMMAGSVALQRDLTITTQNNEFGHTLKCPRFFQSLFQRNTGHDVSVFFHCDARY